MIDGYAIGSFDGSFRRRARNCQGDPELRVIAPWLPVWEQGSEEATSEGYLVRPTYYPEDGFTEDEHQVQAVASTYSTHHGGIAQGPFEAPPGTEIALTALVRHIRPDGVSGDPISRIGLSYAEADALVIAAPKDLSRPYYASYGEWSMMYYRTSTTERLFYVVLLSEWKWRASYCCTLWDSALLTCTLPQQQIPLGGVIRIPHNGRILKVVVTFEQEGD